MRTWAEEVLEKALVSDTHLILFGMLVVVAAIVLDAITKVAAIRRKQTGLQFAQIKSALPGKKWLEVKNYVSPKLHLAGKPDGLLAEDGFVIPVEFKPLGKKVRDRYITQILVYLALIEEATGKAPPYGYLILGSRSKQIKIYNNPKKQEAIKVQIKNMLAITDEKAQSTPHCI